MANPTSNFGWQMPQNTDLVKDLPADFEVFGQAVDTSLMDLKGGTTGQVLSKASNTDMDFTWVAQDDSNAIQNDIVDAKGDLISATAADTPARLASSGVNGDVLTVDTTTATGLKWAAPASGTITWTQRVSANTNGSNLLTVAYNGSNLYIAAGNDGLLYSSSNGTSWTSRTSGFGANTIKKVAYGNGLWVAVGQNGTITTSTDGTTWTARTSNMSTNQIYDVTYQNSIWVAVGDGGGTTNTGGIIYSTDGITWTRKSQSLTVGSSYYAVIWNGTNWVVGAGSSTNNYLYASTPSGTWTAGASGSSSNLEQLFWDGTRMISVDNSGLSRYSTSTTVGTMTSISGGQLRSTIGTNYYYNGKMYSFGQIIYFFSSTPVNDSTDQVQNYGLSPTITITSGGTLNFTSNCIWVGAAGFIVTGSNGRLWTSF